MLYFQSEKKCIINIALLKFSVVIEQIYPYKRILKWKLQKNNQIWNKYDMYVIYRFVYIYKFIFYRFTIYLYKITYIFEKFAHFWVAILRKRQYLSCNSNKIRQFLSFNWPAKSGILIYNSSKSRKFFFLLPPVWRHSIFLEYLWCREYGGIRSPRVNS